MKTLLLILILVLPLLGQVTRPIQTIDLNTATRSQLMALDPIVTQEIADAIIKGRPYKTSNQVAAQIPKEVYEGIRFKLLVGTRIGNVPVEKEPANEREPVRRPIPAPVKREVQVIKGNKIDTIRFEPKPEQETDPKPPSPSVVPPR